MNNFLRICSVLGEGGRVKIRDVCMDLDSCLKVQYLVVIRLNSTKLGQLTNLNVIFYMLVSICKMDKICNSTQAPLNLKVANRTLCSS